MNRKKRKRCGCLSLCLLTVFFRVSAAVVAVAAGPTDVPPALTQTRNPASTVTNTNTTTNTPDLTLESTTHAPSSPKPQPQPNTKKRAGAGTSPQLTDEGAVDIQPPSHSPPGGVVGEVEIGTEPPAAAAKSGGTDKIGGADDLIGAVVYEELPVPMARTGTGEGNESKRLIV